MTESDWVTAKIHELHAGGRFTTTGKYLMGVESDRRNFLLGGSGVAAGLATSRTVAQDKMDDPHAGHGTPASDRGKLTPGFRKAGDPPVPVETPDAPKLKWEIKNGAKEFHLYAQVMKREFLPDQWFDVWGYNGSMPGPMIEVVEGDKVRIVVHNELPEASFNNSQLPPGVSGDGSLLCGAGVDATASMLSIKGASPSPRPRHT